MTIKKLKEEPNKYPDDAEVLVYDGGFAYKVSRVVDWSEHREYKAIPID